MAVLILKHNALTPYASFEGAKAGIVEKMNGAQQGELWAAEYFTSTEGDLNDVKGAILAFKGKNGIVTFADSDNVSEEMKTSLADYYTKTEIDELVENVTNNAIGIAEGDGIAIEGEGTIKTISANLDLNIVTVEGKEMLQLVDGSDNSKVIAEVDASAFVVDGMLSSAEIITVDDETELPEGVELSKGKYIKLSWNTDSGKSNTYVPVADLISEHKVVAGEDVAGEMVIVATNVVESTNENGIKVSTVNVSVDDTAVKSALNEKIGKDEKIFNVNFDKALTFNNPGFRIPVYTPQFQVVVEPNEENCSYSFDLFGKNDEIIGHLGVFNTSTLNSNYHQFPMILVQEGKTLTVFDGNENVVTTLTIEGKKSIIYGESGRGQITVYMNGEVDFTTLESLVYINDEKADINIVEQLTNDINTVLYNKVGKFDTVLSVNDGETNTDYNVEGALDYLNNEIKAMSVIDCGVF